MVEVVEVLGRGGGRDAGKGPCSSPQVYTWLAPTIQTGGRGGGKEREHGEAVGLVDREANDDGFPSSRPRPAA
jgi:hypothetical protein